MAAVGTKLRGGEGTRLSFYCPGCKDSHTIIHGLGQWTWNGNGDKPTFSPSVLVSYPHWVPPVTPENFTEFERAPWEQKLVTEVCHSFVRDGQIQFLGDCTHKLAGQTVDLPDYPKALA